MLFTHTHTKVQVIKNVKVQCPISISTVLLTSSACVDEMTYKRIKRVQYRKLNIMFDPVTNKCRRFHSQAKRIANTCRHFNKKLQELNYFVPIKLTVWKLTFATGMDYNSCKKKRRKKINREIFCTSLQTHIQVLQTWSGWIEISLKQKQKTNSYHGSVTRFRYFIKLPQTFEIPSTYTWDFYLAKVIRKWMLQLVLKKKNNSYHFNLK